MNERIKELIKQCTSWSEGSTWTSHEEFDREKFAELIVQECMAQCADNGSNDEWDKGVRWAANQIKQHFGVEE